MSTTTDTDYIAQAITACQTLITSLETAIAQAITAGQSYSLQGSHSLTRVDIDKLTAQLTAQRRRYAMLLDLQAGRNPQVTKDVYTAFVG